MKAGLLAGRQAGGPAAITDPTDIADLARWVDASDTATITNSAGAVTDWDDKSGLGNHLTTNYNGTPTSGSRTINSLNVIDFNGDDISGGHVNAGVMNPNGVTLFVVYHPDTSHVGSIYNEARTVDNSDYWRLLQLNGVPAFFVRDGTGGNQVELTATTNTVGGDYLLTAALEPLGGAAALRVNGSVEDSISSYSPANPLTLDVGSVGYLVRSSDLQPFDGGVAEIAIYNRALNSTEIGQVEAYLADKWGLTI